MQRKKTLSKKFINNFKCEINFKIKNNKNYQHSKNCE